MIETRDLSFEYKRQESGDAPASVFLALNGININVKKGEFVAVLGQNGSGKSTLAKHFNALLLPSGGKVWVSGMDTASPENVWHIRKAAGMVFQNPENQIIATVVEEDVAFGCENLGLPSAEIRKRVDDALETVRLSDYAEDPPHFLSGGQKQRVAIAGILAMEPECIVLDEPTAMLDPQWRQEILETVLMLNREKGITIVLITHFMDEAVKADRVVVMDGGQIVMDDCSANVFKQVDRLHELGLDVPQVANVANRLRKMGVSLPDDILTIDEMVDAICNLTNCQAK